LVAMGRGKKIAIPILILCMALILTGCAGSTQGPPQAETKAKAESLKALGDAHLREGRFRAAMQSYVEADSLTPDDPELKFRIALVYADYFKRLDEAEKFYREAIRLRGDYSEAYNNLGTVYLRQNRLDEAIGMFRKALENLYYATPELAYYNLGRAHEEKGEEDKAIEFYEMAIELRRPYLDPYGRLGLLYEKRGKYREALRVFQELASQLEKKDPKKARNEEELRENRASLAGAYYHQGLCFQKLGRREEAREALERALELAPDGQMKRTVKQALDSISR
jgi:type IV pilus assembly protein PilF